MQIQRVEKKDLRSVFVKVRFFASSALDEDDGTRFFRVSPNVPFFYERLQMAQHSVWRRDADPERDLADGGAHMIGPNETPYKIMDPFLTRRQPRAASISGGTFRGTF